MTTRLRRDQNVTRDDLAARVQRWLGGGREEVGTLEHLARFDENNQPTYTCTCGVYEDIFCFVI